MAPSSLKVKFDSASNKIQSTLGIWVDDVKVKLTLTDKSVKDVKTLPDDFQVAVERPGHFILEHHPNKKYTRFQFHSSADVLDKKVKLTFSHTLGSPGTTTLEGASALNKSNKVTIKQNFAKPAPIVKYEYSHHELAVEPQFDFGEDGKDSWGVSLKYGHGKKESVKATYLHKKKTAELELHKKIDNNGGPLKITATVDTNNLKKVPKLVFEKEWNM